MSLFVPHPLDEFIVRKGLNRSEVSYTHHALHTSPIHLVPPLQASSPSSLTLQYHPDSVCQTQNDLLHPLSTINCTRYPHSWEPAIPQPGVTQTLTLAWEADRCSKATSHRDVDRVMEVRMKWKWRTPCCQHRSYHYLAWGMETLVLSVGRRILVPT